MWHWFLCSWLKDMYAKGCYFFPNRTVLTVFNITKEKMSDWSMSVSPYYINLYLQIENISFFFLTIPTSSWNVVLQERTSFKTYFLSILALRVPHHFRYPHHCNIFSPYPTLFIYILLNSTSSVLLRFYKVGLVFVLSIIKHGKQ